ELLELDVEVGLLAGERRLGIVIGKRDVEARLLAGLDPEQIGLEARDQTFLAEDQRHPLGRAAIEWHAALRPRVADDRVVAVARATALDWRERRVLVSQLVDDLLDLGLV